MFERLQKRFRRDPETAVRRLVRRRTKKGINFLTLSRALADALLLNDRRRLRLSPEVIIEIVKERAVEGGRSVATVNRVASLQETQDVLSND